MKLKHNKETERKRDRQIDRDRKRDRDRFLVSVLEHLDLAMPEPRIFN